jgi:predicted RNA-binding protein Jag
VPSPVSPELQQAVEEAIEEIQELYGTAKDEFEMAFEESEKNTTYAADDRAAARVELDSLLEYYRGVVEGEDRAVADEVKRRVGQRIRELENAVLAMEEAATHGD